MVARLCSAGGWGQLDCTYKIWAQPLTPNSAPYPNRSKLLNLDRNGNDRLGSLLCSVMSESQFPKFVSLELKRLRQTAKTLKVWWNLSEAACFKLLIMLFRAQTWHCWLSNLISMEEPGSRGIASVRLPFAAFQLKFWRPSSLVLTGPRLSMARHIMASAIIKSKRMWQLEEEHRNPCRCFSLGPLEASACLPLNPPAMVEQSCTERFCLEAPQTCFVLREVLVVDSNQFPLPFVCSENCSRGIIYPVIQHEHLWASMSIYPAPAQAFNKCSK